MLPGFISWSSIFCTFQQHRMPPDARGHGRLELQTLVSLCQIYHSELILFKVGFIWFYLVFLIRPTIASTIQDLCYTVIQLHICHLWMCNYGVTMCHCWFSPNRCPSPPKTEKRSLPRWCHLDVRFVLFGVWISSYMFDVSYIVYVIVYSISSKA